MAIAQQAYLESTVLCADAVELVQMLYQAALDSVETARRRLRQGDIPGRSQQLTRAGAILTELALSLKHQAELPLSRNLAELYDYMQRRLIEANVRQVEAPLAEVSRLLATLLEAWLRLKPVETSAPRRAAPPPEPALEYAPQSWSF